MVTIKRKFLSGVIGGFIGFVAGVFGGGYLGLVIGGTFLGALEIRERTGFEGYELAAYIGAIIGAVVVSVAGVWLALRFADKK